MTADQIKEVLSKLDSIYGTTKEGFLHDSPWQLLVAIMLSAQSTDRQVESVLPSLFKKYPTVDAVAQADVEDLENCIKSIGLYHNKAKNIKSCCERLAGDFNGEVPAAREELTTLPGVGRKTANLFLSDYYGISTITVDTHVNRISNRLGWSDSKDPVKVEQQLMNILPKDHWIRINFQLIYHGRAICKARKPLCSSCPLSSCCDYARKP